MKNLAIENLTMKNFVFTLLLVFAASCDSDQEPKDAAIDKNESFRDSEMESAPSQSEIEVSGDEARQDGSILPENDFLSVEDNALSTFSIDVDTASYSIARSYLNDHQLPPAAVVRVEEFVNYFAYEYPQPNGDHPFSVSTETTEAPWNDAHRLVKIGLKGRNVSVEDRPPANLVFLVDVSGSMSAAKKLPLLKQALALLVEELRSDDKVGIVTYAGQAGVALSPTPGENRKKILAAIAALGAGGSTNGAAGISTAYDLVAQNYIQEGINRVILATDGDFNVGITNNDDLVAMIRKKAEGGTFLTTLGFGMRFNDNRLETLADKGNGAYGYIDSLREARKILAETLTGTLLTIAKDVKIQLEFNEENVKSYRLIGYENRLLKAEDFADDKKDAGEIGAGHTVTAFYQIELKSEVDPVAAPVELFKIRLRYKAPEDDTSVEFDTTVSDTGKTFSDASGDFRFATAVAAFGMVLRGSSYAGDADFQQIIDVAESATGADLSGHRAEFVSLVARAKSLTK